MSAFQKVPRNDIIKNDHLQSISHYVPPKLINVKYAIRLQTVSELYYVRQGVKSQRHLNEGAAGQATYHKTQCPK